MAISILNDGTHLIASIQEAPLDSDWSRLQQDLLQRVRHTRARGVIVDVAALDVLDSFAVRVLSDVARTIKLLGAETVIVGIHPDVAFAMIQLGLSLDGILTGLDLEDGILCLNRLAGKSGHVR